MKSPICILALFLFSNISVFAEVEPNNNCLTANAINIGGSITGNFELPNDRDYFSFTITQSDLYVIEVQHPDSTLQIQLGIHPFKDCYTGYGINSIFKKGTLRKFIFFLSDTGKLYLDLRLNVGVSSLTNYTLSFFRNTDDAFEYNNTRATAAKIPLDSLATAYIQGFEFKTGYLPDQDYYKVFVPAKGKLDIDLPVVPHDTDFILHVQLFDSLGIFIAQDCICGNTLLTEYLQTIICDPGTYYILINEWHGLYSHDPYKFIVKFTADTTECNDDIAYPFPIQNQQTITGYSGGTNGSTRIHDVDYYSFDVPQPGVFNLNIFRSDTFEYEVEVYNKYLERVIETHYDKDGIYYWNELSLCDSGMHIMKLTDQSYRTDCHRKNKFTKYELQLDNVFPDKHECNDTYEAATLLTGKDTIYAAFATYRDTDIYRVYLLKHDTLTIIIDSMPADMFLDEAILNKSKIKLQGMPIYSYPTNLQFVNSGLPGEFYLRLILENSKPSNEQYKMIVDRKSLSTSVKNDLIKLNLIANISSEKLNLYNDIYLKSDEVYYVIVNTLGLTVDVIQKMDQSGTIDISKLSNGIYTLILYGSYNKKQIHKFVKI